MEWLASIVGVIGIGGLIACIGFILLVLGIAGTGVEPLTGGIVLAIGAVAAIGGLLYAIPAFLNGDQVDLYEQAYADYSQRRIELTNEITAVNEVAVNLGVERLYATCLVAGSDSAHRSIPREHIPNVHDMELLGVTCDSVSDLHDSTVTENADQPVLELSRRAGIEGVVAAVDGQRTNIAPEPLATAPGLAPELNFLQKRTTRKGPLRETAEDIQNQTIDLDQDLDNLATIKTLLADEYSDLRRANLALKSSISAGMPNESNLERTLLLLDRPPLAEHLQAP